MSINPKSWAETFTARLTVEGEHVPLDRVVAQHSEAFTELRRLGLTWRGISGLLVRAGARRPDGGLISSDQLRVSYARCRGEKGASSPRAKRGTSQPSATTTDSPPLVVALQPQHQPSETSREEQPTEDKDVSGSEVEAALARLSKI